MSRIRRRIKPALMVIAGVCTVATAAGAMPATAHNDTSAGAQAHARAASPQAHARAAYTLA